MNKQGLKKFLFRILRTDPEAIIVHVCAGPRAECEAMSAEVRLLIPDRRHMLIRLATEEPLSGDGFWRCVTLPPTNVGRGLKKALQGFRVGLAPTRWVSGHPLCRAALRVMPTKILAFNEQIERWHLSATAPIASWLFLRGVPLDRIRLRPRWWPPWRADPSRSPSHFCALPARGPRAGFPRVAIFTPYSPYPLAHGGAVRMFALLREVSQEFDIYLFWFSEGEQPGPLQDLCAGLYACDLPYYREPRWSTIDPPEVRERWAPALAADLERICRQEQIALVQIEFTQLARYRGDVLVEHDVTFDLYRQIWEREPTRLHRWDWWRWRRFEETAVGRFRRVVVMSEKDRLLLPDAKAAVIPNGVDLDRFRPSPEGDFPTLLFVGSFRHFPNISAYRFFVEQVWPKIKVAHPDCRLTVIAGPDPLLYWKQHVGTGSPACDETIELFGFTEDVRPFYERAQIVVVPTTVSAGTNLKVLEAMAMQRAVVSTSSGCAGLNTDTGEQLVVAESAEEFAAAVLKLLEDRAFRLALAERGRRHVEQYFGWAAMGVKQAELWRSLLP